MLKLKRFSMPQDHHELKIAEAHEDHANLHSVDPKARDYRALILISGPEKLRSNRFPMYYQFYSQVDENNV